MQQGFDVQSFTHDVQHRDRHAVFGQRARFIRTDNGGRAQCLYCGQFADEGMALEDALRAQGQGNGDDGR